MEHMIDLFRGTGRTTRMLHEAARLAQEGRYVLVVAADKNQAGELCARFAALVDGRRVGGDKVYVVAASVPAQERDPAACGEVSFITAAMQRIDFRLGQAVGAHPSVRLLADHYVLESYFRQIAPWAWNEWIAASIDPRTGKGKTT